MMSDHSSIIMAANDAYVHNDALSTTLTSPNVAMSASPIEHDIGSTKIRKASSPKDAAEEDLTINRLHKFRQSHLSDILRYVFVYR